MSDVFNVVYQHHQQKTHITVHISTSNVGQKSENTT